jgi:hypothetical protein
MRTEQIPHVEALSPTEFREQYGDPGRPIVISNALKWPALKRWTHEWFRKQFGEMEVALSVNPTHTHRPVRMRLDAYIDRIISNQRMEGGLYLDQFPLSRLPALYEDFSVPAYCKPDREVIPHLWLGPGTTVLSFHKDNQNPLVQIDNIFVQICGRKRFILASEMNDPFMYPRSTVEGAYWHSLVDPEKPDFVRFPLFDHVVMQEAIVGPGDIIFIPRNYWHHVRALERSISMSFWWNPYRLMELARFACVESEAPTHRPQGLGALSVTHADIVEFGGKARLENIFCEFANLDTLRKICSRLLVEADEGAREALEGALLKAVTNRRLADRNA